MRNQRNQHLQLQKLKEDNSKRHTKAQTQDHEIPSLEGLEESSKITTKQKKTESTTPLIKINGCQQTFRVTYSRS